MDNSKKRKVSAAAPEAAEPTSEKRMPVRTLRQDDCSASVWAREYLAKGKPTMFYSVTLERSYKDRDGSWKYTKSFSADDLGKIVTLCQQAETAISELREQEAAQ